MSVKQDFMEGRQPCDNFNPKDGVMPSQMNLHECPNCLFTRSFCNNCYSDHHYKGWDLHDLIARDYDIKYKDD